MKTVIHIQFTKTDDNPAYDAYISVGLGLDEAVEFLRALDDAIAGYMESVFEYDPSVDDNYERAITDIMNASGKRWAPARVAHIYV